MGLASLGLELAVLSELQYSVLLLAVVLGLDFSGRATLRPGRRYGWINYVEDCRFSGNGIGLEIYNSVNGWDITNNVVEACHVGIYAADATSVLIEGSVIESVGVPIMLFVSLTRSHRSHCETVCVSFWLPRAKCPELKTAALA
jgi:parallel beta-helix repeat protein